jgi:hypothetical protein
MGPPGVLLAGLRVQAEGGCGGLVSGVGADRGEAALQPVVGPAQGAGVAAHGHVQHTVVAAAALVQQATVAGGGQAQFEAGVVRLAVGADAFVEAAAQQAVGGQRVADLAVALRVARAHLAAGHPVGRGDAQPFGRGLRQGRAACCRLRLRQRCRGRSRCLLRQRTAGQQQRQQGQGGEGSQVHGGPGPVGAAMLRRTAPCETCPSSQARLAGREQTT